MPAGFLVLPLAHLGDAELGAEDGDWISFSISVRPSVPSPTQEATAAAATAAAAGFTELFSSSPALLLSASSSAAPLLPSCSAPPLPPLPPPLPLLEEVLPRSTTFGQKSLVSEDVAARSLARPRKSFLLCFAAGAVALRSPSVQHVTGKQLIIANHVAKSRSAEQCLGLPKRQRNPLTHADGKEAAGLAKTTKTTLSEKRRRVQNPTVLL